MHTPDLFDVVPEPPVQYVRGWLEAAHAEALLADLLTEVAWRQDEMPVPGGPVRLPRLTAWQGEPGAVYRYSGILNRPAAFTPSVLMLRERLERELSARFNSVLLNLYRDGEDSLGWHADDEPELGPRPLIASVSLGAERVFEMRHRRQSALLRAWSLAAGSLLVMRDDAQSDWLHRVPRAAGCHRPRINLTFRWVNPC